MHTFDFRVVIEFDSCLYKRYQIGQSRMTKYEMFAEPALSSEILKGSIYTPNIKPVGKLHEEVGQVLGKPVNSLQSHVSFFDRNGDGVITMPETFESLLLLNYSFLGALVVTFLNHFMFSYNSCESWIPDFRLPIYVKNIRKCKHGSDSGVFGCNGEIKMDVFEKVIKPYSKDGCISFLDGWKMTNDFRQSFDIVGWIFSKLNWLFLFFLVAKNGKVSVDDVYDSLTGTLFHRLAEENKKTC